MSAIKEACSKVKPELIAKLKSPNEVVLEIFGKIFHVLYDKEEKSFMWDEFKKRVLLADNGNEFLSRLANVNV